MKSETVGKNILGVEVTNISSHGIWLYSNDKEYFLSHEEYPWFKNATIAQILNVKLLHSHHLYWPDIDIDLSIGTIEFPENYPLTAK